jgi:hypothetical protein
MLKQTFLFMDLKTMGPIKVRYLLVITKYAKTNHSIRNSNLYIDHSF